MVLLATVFVASRWLLVQTSYAAHAHWEESVFLFSALEISHQGLSSVWDYQDDLSHGGSVPLLLLATAAVALCGPSMVALKAVCVAWSLGAFLLTVAAVRRAGGAGAALLSGVFLLALSPNLARLQVTLVGSHPEALLPAAAALWWLAKHDGTEGTVTRDSVAIGALAASAVWMSLTLAPWMAALAAVWWLGAPRRVAAAAGLLAGGIVGGTPWAYQNLYLRPHGATLWLQRLGSSGAEFGAAQGAWGTLQFLPESWGLGEAGVALTALAALAWLALALAVGLREQAERRWLRVAGTLLLGSLLTAVSLAATHLQPAPNEGYYFARFFAPLQVQLLVIGSLAVDTWAARLGGWVRIAFGGAAVAIGVSSFAPLLYQGGEVPAVNVLLRRGCLVFGNAEYARAGDGQRAVWRLMQLADAPCREMACAGLGWALADEYAATGRIEGARAALAAAGTTNCAQRICGGMRFVLARRAGILEERRKLPAEFGERCP